MGLSMITALEIFTNPGDLEITIGQEKEGAKFAFGIFRGPGHNYKPMLTSQPFTEIREDAIKAVEGVLQTVHEAITKQFKNSGAGSSSAPRAGSGPTRRAPAASVTAASAAAASVERREGMRA